MRIQDALSFETPSFGRLLRMRAKMAAAINAPWNRRDLAVRSLYVKRRRAA
jgi:hypothetical protein